MEQETELSRKSIGRLAAIAKVIAFSSLVTVGMVAENCWGPENGHQIEVVVSISPVTTPEE